MTNTDISLPVESIGSAPRATVVPKLSLREREVLLAWIRCDSKEEVRTVLGIALSTVNTHLFRIREKYDAVGRPAHTKAQLVARSLQDGWITLGEL
ncbi:LuxR C-terminal-related transcriptional regulator [Nocardia sp. NPDC046763]|uniref:helix-turn-helix transcriptional regulator n=1 Tax=Nocardia sp. NPDC046763 TaxID=3155256 RepID=UPI0033C36BEB